MPTEKATGCSNKGASGLCTDARMREGAHHLCSEAIEQTGRPEPMKQNLKLPRLSNPFGKKNSKVEWKEATIFELIPELEP
jgi:hypothetical protein